MSRFKSTIYAYDAYLEGGLFDNLSLPEGIDDGIVKTQILLECGEMQPLYTDPDFMQQMIGWWSAKWYPTFEKWITALNIEYDPLNNYDRHEEWTDEIYSSSTGSADTSKSAYDSATLTPYDKVETANGGNSFDTKKGHAYGNIGVTTSQQMLEAELDISKWNIYEHIKDIFMQEFCIMIY